MKREGIVGFGSLNKGSFSIEFSEDYESNILITEDGRAVYEHSLEAAIEFLKEQFTLRIPQPPAPASSGTSSGLEGLRTP